LWVGSRRFSFNFSVSTICLIYVLYLFIFC
jgi:hypothetical protein